MHSSVSLLTQMMHTNCHITLGTAFDQAEHVIVYSSRFKHVASTNWTLRVLHSLAIPLRHLRLVVPCHVVVHLGSRSTFSSHISPSLHRSSCSSPAEGNFRLPFDFHTTKRYLLFRRCQRCQAGKTVDFSLHHPHNVTSNIRYCWRLELG